jgi:hypothetical protein
MSNTSVTNGDSQPQPLYGMPMNSYLGQIPLSSSLFGRSAALDTVRPSELLLGLYNPYANRPPFPAAQSGGHTRTTMCQRFDPGGVPAPASKLSLRVPAQMGRRETEHKGETVRGNHDLVLSCAQGGCACSRGLQAFARERERARALCVGPFSRAATFSYESPGPSFYRCKERAQVYNGGCSNVLTCLAGRSQSPVYMPTWLLERCCCPVHVMSWPSEERLSPVEAHLSGPSDPC